MVGLRQSFALTVHIEQRTDKTQGEHTDGHQHQPQFIRSLFIRFFVLISDAREQGGYLPTALTRAIDAGALTGEVDITVGTIHITL